MEIKTLSVRGLTFPPRHWLLSPSNFYCRIGHAEGDAYIVLWKGNQRLWRKPFQGSSWWTRTHSLLHWGKSNPQPLTLRQVEPTASYTEASRTHSLLHWGKSNPQPLTLRQVECFNHLATYRWYCSSRPYSHKLLTNDNYVNCPSNFEFAGSICLFHRPSLRKSLCEYGLLTQTLAGLHRSSRCTRVWCSVSCQWKQPSAVGRIEERKTSERTGRVRGLSFTKSLDEWVGTRVSYKILC